MELSRPYQVLLGLALVLAAAWFVVLKPGSSTTASSGAAAAPAAQAQPPSPAPSHGEALPGGLGRAVAKAHGATDQANATAGADPTSAPAPAAASAVPATPNPAAVPSAAPVARIRVPATAAPVVRAGARAMVLLFYNPQSADDQAVRGELRAIDTRRGAVVVRAVPLTQLYRYRAVLNGTPVTQSPTVLVLSARHVAQELTGLVDTANLQQAVRDALA